ncbi:MAG: YifB family Mg chelatase-like AAA ATPase [Opitutales bacterium]
MLAVVSSGALQGIDAVPVEVECNTGLPGEAKPVVVGLPSAAVKESWDRVYSALANSGFGVPQTKCTINLAPGHLRKEGPLYDLPIALGLLAAMGVLKSPALDQYLIAGELSLSGETRPVKGGLALASLARERRCKALLLPPLSAHEAALVEDFPVVPVESLSQAVAFLEGREAIAPLAPGSAPTGASGSEGGPDFEVDFAEVKGQHALRRAVEVAVAGAHNLLVVGPPGSGKSMVARRIPTIVPPLAFEEFLDVLRVYSATGRTLEPSGMRRERPFRAPHHTISDVGLIGGGSVPGPGEISLAHHGVLFLDELPEFKRSALEVLRQPLEDGQVTISRSAGSITLPARFMLVAAMNPTPDGLHPAESRSTPTQIQRYHARLSAPLLDRIDLHVEAPALSVGELRQAAPGESSATIRERVAAARQRQVTRFAGTGFATNAAMTSKAIRHYCAITASQGDLLQQAMERLQLSARAYDRILKVARSIADLAGTQDIETPHLLEAIQYRSLDRSLTG